MSLKLKKIKNKIKNSLTRTKNSLIRTKNSLSKKIKVKRSTLQIVFLTLLTQYSFKIFAKWIKAEYNDYILRNRTQGEGILQQPPTEESTQFTWILFFIKGLWKSIFPPPKTYKKTIIDDDGKELEVTVQEESPPIWKRIIFIPVNVVKTILGGTWGLLVGFAIILGVIGFGQLFAP